MKARLGYPLLVLLPVAIAYAQAASGPTFVLDHSTLTYHMSHVIHEVDGLSHEGRGKGVCNAGMCDFLVAAAVKTFDSGDSNRDLHMQQVARAAQNPIVTVRFRMPESAVNAPSFDVDLDVQLAGITAHYSHVAFQQAIEGSEHHITGVVPSKVSDFKIDPPSFLGVSIKNQIPVKVDTTWHAQ